MNRDGVINMSGAVAPYFALVFQYEGAPRVFFPDDPTVIWESVRAHDEELADLLERVLERVAIWQEEEDDTPAG